MAFGCLPKTNFPKSSILDAWWGSECVFVTIHFATPAVPCINHLVINVYPIRSQCTLSLPPEIFNRKVFWCFQGVDKGCIGSEWVNNKICESSFVNFLLTHFVTTLMLVRNVLHFLTGFKLFQSWTMPRWILIQFALIKGGVPKLMRISFIDIPKPNFFFVSVSSINF